VDPNSSIETQPLFRLGQWVNGLIDGAAGAAVGLFDRALRSPAEVVTLIAVVGLGCAVLAWLFGAVFARANRPARRAPPAAPPAVSPAVVIQTRKAPRISRPAPLRRGAGARPKRRPRRQTNPILRWLGLT